LIWTLIPVSAIYGLAAALVFIRFADRASIRRTTNRMIAHVMEFRLFIDSPALVLRAQRDLLRENLHLLRLILLPCAILALIFIFLFPPLDAMYGHMPLKAGERAIVTAHAREDVTLKGATLEAPPGIEVETPGAWNVHERQISWRVRALGRVSGELKIGSVTKRIVAGGGLINGWKIPFRDPEIEIQYPRAAVLGVNWMVWFFVISSAAASGCSAIGYRR
jgi:hypothetical protein